MKVLSSIVKISLITLVSFLLLTGCYSQKELDDLAYVICIGADKGEGDNLKITLQIAVPIKISGESSKGGEESVTIITVDSPSLATALSVANSTISKELNIAHTKLIVFSEELAKEGLEGYLNIFVSNEQIRPRTSITVCRGTAEDFIKAVKPKLEINPARYYDLIINSYNYTGYNTIGNELIDFYTAVSSPATEATSLLAEIDYSKKENPMPKFLGIAVFSGGRMVGEIIEKETISHLLLSGDLKKVNIEIQDEDIESVIKLSQSKKPKIKIHMKDDTPIININLPVEAQLIKGNRTVDYMNEENKAKLSEAIKKEVGKLLNSYLEKTSKEFKSDIIGFGRYAKINYKTWDEFMKSEWLKKYEHAEFNLNISVSLNTSQIVSHSLPPISAQEGT